jgi:hypothetical protein
MKLSEQLREVETYEEACELAEAYEAEQEKRIAELEAETNRLRECMRIAGLECFMRKGSPESVAQHMHEVATSWTKRIAELQSQLANAAKYANAIGQIESALGIFGTGPLSQTLIKMREVVRRCTELEAQNVALTCDMNAFRLRCETLQYQLTWTPVSAGLPTEPGWYEFFCCGQVCVLTLDGVWEDSDGDELDIEEIRVDYESFRRIELPEAP